MTRYSLLAAAALMAIAIPTAYAAEHTTPERMQERNMQMRSMMDQMQQTKTPAERQKLMAGHMKTMQEQMAAMHDMTGPSGMMGKSQGGTTTDPDVASQMQMMQQRMTMMQQMMEHMMYQQGMAMPAK